jgi:hypothetical protein
MSDEIEMDDDEKTVLRERACQLGDEIMDVIRPNVSTTGPGDVINALIVVMGFVFSACSEDSAQVYADHLIKTIPGLIAEARIQRANLERVH